MNLSTNPGVWRAAVASIVAAAVSAGVLAPEWGDRINGWAAAGVVVLTALLPIASAVWAKMHTVPVQPGTPAAVALIRQPDGVYVSAGRHAAQEAEDAAIRRAGGDLGT